MSASISCSEALAAIRQGERLPAALVRSLGEEQPGEFFRVVVESLADSFDPAQAAAYEELMRAWIPAAPRIQPVIPESVETVYVLSRVTLGADIKITSVILDAMKKRFPAAAIVLVANRKSIELFSADSRIWHIEAEYPRSGPVSQRIEFADELRRRLEGTNRIVVDPDSRMTQLGLAPVCEAQDYFHFSSRTANSADNLTELTQHWLEGLFGECGEAYIAPDPVRMEGDSPRAAVSLGVGENDSKRIGGNFEGGVIRALGEKFRTIWIDRGVGGEEARRVTAAAEASGRMDRIRFWEGSFAGFASIISQCDFYAGYDSAGQHAAAAVGVPMISIFAGAPSERFRQRWSPAGPGRIDVINADSLTPDKCLERFRALLEWRSVMTPQLTRLPDGFAAAVMPITAATITTSSDGLMAGELEIPAGDLRIPAYRAKPASGTAFPIILVVQEIFGIHEHIKDLCRRLAKRGYLAVAPYLYEREGDVSGLESIDEIRSKVVSRVPDAQVMRDLDATVDWAAKDGGDTKRLAASGFCWGGRIVWLYAAHSATLKAGAAWYGRLAGPTTELQPKNPVDLAKDLKAPVIGLYGGKDAGISLETVEKMRAALDAAHKPDEISVYPEAQHGFNADYRPAYDPAAAKDAWSKMVAFFQKHGV